MPLSSHPQQAHNVVKIRDGMTESMSKGSAFQTPREATPAAASQQQQFPTLPPSQTFDVLPALHEILARIDHTSSGTASLPPARSTEKDAAELGALYADLPPLEPKDLSTEVLQVKAKIRKALKELEKLPDMDRSVSDQEEEIHELEARIKEQQQMINTLATLAKDLQGRLG
jgi:uncharacterized protein YoaH (UPF0181 family)